MVRGDDVRRAMSLDLIRAVWACFWISNEHFRHHFRNLRHWKESSTLYELHCDFNEISLVV
jgi:hypothetical protein